MTVNADTPKSALSAAEKKALLAERLQCRRKKRKLLANIWAMRRYMIKPYAGHLHLFLTKDSLQKRNNDQLKWTKYALTGAALHDIPGDHETITGTGEAMIEEVYVKVLAEKLTACIKAVLHRVE